MGEAKVLRNIQGGLDEMLIIAYIVGGWVQKSPKKCLRNIWTVPKKLNDQGVIKFVQIIGKNLASLLKNS